MKQNMDIQTEIVLSKYRDITVEDITKKWTTVRVTVLPYYPTQCVTLRQVKRGRRRGFVARDVHLVDGSVTHDPPFAIDATWLDLMLRPVKKTTGVYVMEDGFR